MENIPDYEPQQFGKVRYAGFSVRLIAYLVDTIVMSFVCFGVMMILGPSFLTSNYFNSPEDYDLSSIFRLEVILIIINWLYFALMESSVNQATLGKLALGIKVTDLNGNRISFARATGRFFAKIISGLILFIGYLMVIWDPNKQALHDKLANTFVVHKMMM